MRAVCFLLQTFWNRERLSPECFSSSPARWSWLNWMPSERLSCKHAAIIGHLLNAVASVAKAWQRGLLHAKHPMGNSPGKAPGGGQKEQGDGGAVTIVKSLGAFCEWPQRMPLWDQSEGSRGAGEMQVDDGRGRCCARSLCLAAFGSILAPRHLICKIPVASQRGAVSGGTSRARPGLVATPYLQPAQPQPAAAPCRAGGPEGAGRDRVRRKQRQEED